MSEFLIFVFAVFFGAVTSSWLKSILLKHPDHISDSSRNGFIKIGAVLAFICILVFCLLFDWWSILFATCLIVWMLVSIGKNNSEAKKNSLRLLYRDADGITTQREIVNWRNSFSYIDGFCLLRKENRTFRKDRIVQFIDGRETLLQAQVEVTPPPTMPTKYFTEDSEPKKRKVGKITGRVLQENPASDKIIAGAKTKPAVISSEDLTNLYAELAALEKFKGLADIDAEALKIRKEADDYVKEKRAKAENIILVEANAIAKKIIADAEAKAAGIMSAKTAVPKIPKKPTRANSSIFRARNIDTVTFDYINAEGEYSSRRVKVNMVGQWEFGGIDLSKRETRTFKFERVVGEIVSEVSGEIIHPETWAEDLHLQ